MTIRLEYHSERPSHYMEGKELIPTGKIRYTNTDGVVTMALQVQYDERFIVWKKERWWHFEQAHIHYRKQTFWCDEKHISMIEDTVYECTTKSTGD